MYSAFDVDKRKVGLPIAKAIFAEPNCPTIVFQKSIPVNGVRVKMGPLLDGMADHMIFGINPYSFNYLSNYMSLQPGDTLLQQAHHQEWAWVKNHLAYLKPGDEMLVCQ